MKKSRILCSILFIALFTNLSNAQVSKNYIHNDSIFSGNELVGLIGRFSTAIFVDKSSMKLFRNEREKYEDIIKWYKVDPYVFSEELIIDRKSNSILYADGTLIGKISVTADKDILVTLFSMDADRKHISHTLNQSGLISGNRIVYETDSKILADYNRKRKFEQDSIKEFNTQRKLLEAAKVAEKEKKRIERFYATLSERLNQELDPIEGVYKSIDQGEDYEYDIAILKSTNDGEYIGLVLGSTDPSFRIGTGVFTFTKTAGANLFFVSYQSKAGQRFENKTATFDGVLLAMGVKSFVKMYPSEGDTRRFNEVNPLFDWESSGSGALINKEGYIITNNHVVTRANKIRIAFQNDSIDYNAVVISQNETADIALLQIVDDRFKCELAPVSWSTDFNLGQRVFTLGYPISNKMSDNVKVVDGIVSGTNGRSGDPMFFQTTLPVWYGNSGGPCFNSKGEILGLATQILWDRGEKVDNVAYITKTENIFDLGKELIEKGKNDGEDKNLEQLIEQLIPYSVFIKVNY